MIFINSFTISRKDEEKNCQFREEYRNYEYRKDFNSGFYVFIREKNSQNISCDDKEDFIAAIEDGNLKQVSSISIRLELHFSKGNSYRLESHKNVFLIAFEPYSIRFPVSQILKTRIWIKLKKVFIKYLNHLQLPIQYFVISVIRRSTDVRISRV